MEIFNFCFRFRHTAAHANWDVSSGASDAIALSVDLTGIILHGVGVYCAHHDQEQSFICEVNLSFFISKYLFVILDDLNHASYVSWHTFSYIMYAVDFMNTASFRYC